MKKFLHCGYPRGKPACLNTMEVTAAVKISRNTPIRAHTNTQRQKCKTISLCFLKQYEYVIQSKLKLYKTILLYLTINQDNQIRLDNLLDAS